MESIRSFDVGLPLIHLVADMDEATVSIPNVMELAVYVSFKCRLTFICVVQNRHNMNTTMA